MKKYDELINHFTSQYGEEGTWAFEALCLTEEQLNSLTLSELDCKVQGALQDMGYP